MKKLPRGQIPQDVPQDVGLRLATGQDHFADRSVLAAGLGLIVERTGSFVLER